MCVVIRSLVCRKVCSTKTTGYTDACNTYYFISVYTTVCLKINPQIRNM